MGSNAKRGAYYKAKTRKVLEGMGYQVANMEIQRTLWRRGKPTIFQKFDQFGADLLALDKYGILFVQVKGGATAKAKISEGLKAFAAFTFPPNVACEVWAWLPRAKEPVRVRYEQNHQASSAPAAVLAGA